MTLLTSFLWIPLGFVALAVALQLLRYQLKRRRVVHDRQRLLYPSSTLHVASLLKLQPGAELIGSARDLVVAVEAAGGSVVYAGKVVIAPLASSQLPAVEWDLVLLAHYSSRDAWQQATSSPDVQKALAAFEQVCSHGLERSALGNALLPVMLLGVRAMDVLRRRPARYPFEPVSEDQRAELGPSDRERVLERLEGAAALGRDAIVILNFIRHGDAAQRVANAGYSREMIGLMAEQGHGPMHMGRAVSIEGDAVFDQIVLVYYPGIEYFVKMTASRFFNGIAGGKQLGDTQVVVTVPLLPRLLDAR